MYVFVSSMTSYVFFFFFQAEDGIRDVAVTGVQTCALPISLRPCRILPARKNRQRSTWWGAEARRPSRCKPKGPSCGFSGGRWRNGGIDDAVSETAKDVYGVTITSATQDVISPPGLSHSKKILGYRSGYRHGTIAHGSGKIGKRSAH